MGRTVSIEQVRAAVTESADTVDLAVAALIAVRDGVAETVDQVRAVTQGTAHPKATGAVSRLEEAVGVAGAAVVSMKDGVVHARAYAGAV